MFIVFFLSVMFYHLKARFGEKNNDVVGVFRYQEKPFFASKNA